ncbi:MAG: CopG family ribbon-helix-helix protein [Syntrophobacteraceae bacterium]|nr:CopG family ribbon-helix-helix protein [Syntrophobacteraceae bacterium]
MPTTTITIRTNSELAEKIAALAEATDRSRNWVIEEALKQYVETQMWQIEGIKAAIASLDNGEGVPHEQVLAEANALLDQLDDTP